MSTTDPKMAKGRKYSIPFLPADDPIYTRRGYYVGGYIHSANTSKKNVPEDPSDTQSLRIEEAKTPSRPTKPNEFFKLGAQIEDCIMALMPRHEIRRYMIIIGVKPEDFDNYIKKYGWMPLEDCIGSGLY